MKVKIITQKEAFMMGLTTNNPPCIRPGGGSSGEYMYGIVCKKGDPIKKGIAGAPLGASGDKVVERFRTHIKTKKREVLFEDPEYRNFRIKNNIHKQ